MITCFKRFFILSFTLCVSACDPISLPVTGDDLAFLGDAIHTDAGAIHNLDSDIKSDQTFVEVDFHILDQTLPNDMVLQLDADPWLSSTCQNQPSPLLPNPEDITRLKRKYSIKTGQALGQQKLIIYQARDDEQNREYLSLIGHQLSLKNTQGQLIWERNTPSLSRLHGLYDFNGDSTLEILASSSQRVYLYNLATGTELWHSEPEDLGDEQALSTIYSVKVSQVFDELFPYLYVSDAGCSTAGTGYGIVYRFLAGFEEVNHQVISGPRQAGRCAKWHTIRRKNNFSTQDEVFVLFTDQRGLHAFSADHGERLFCGVYGQDLIAGKLPYKSLNNEQSWAWLSVLDEQVSYLGIRAYEDRDYHCESDEEVIAPIWQTNLVNASPRGLINIDLNADGLDEIWVNHHTRFPENNGEPQWMSSIIDGRTGQILATLSGMAVLSHLSWSVNDLGESLVDILVSIAPNSAWPIGDIASDYQIIRVNLSQFNQMYEASESLDLIYESMWAQPLRSVQPIWQGALLKDSSEFSRVLKIRNNREQHLVFKRINNQERAHNQEQLISIGTRGTIHELSSEYGWAYVGPLCDQNQDCEYISQIRAVESNGAVSILNWQLDPEPNTSSSLEFVTGINAFSLYLPEIPLKPRLATLSEAGQLAVFPLDLEVLNQGSPPALWRRSVTALASSQELGPYKPFITSGDAPKVIAHQRKSPTQSTWLAFDLESGDEVWRHSLPSALWYSEKQYFTQTVIHENQDTDIVFRVDRALNPESIDSLPSCAGPNYEYAHSALFNASSICPELITTPRVIHALDADDGTCLWRVILQENNPCSRPSLQNLSLLDLNQDGNDELYYLESDALRVFNPMTGELLESKTIPRRPDQRLVSGGWLKAFNGALMRFGTFSPPDLYQAPNQNDLDHPLSAIEPLWLGNNINGVRNQSWLRSWAVTTPENIWLRLGLNRPLIRYDDQGEIDLILELSVHEHSPNHDLINTELQVNHLDQEQLLDSTATITGLNENAEGGLIATTNEGGLFIIDQDGILQWSRRFNANPNLPLFTDWDTDERQEWILATANGEINLYDQEIYQGIAAIWESSCDQESQCSIAEDVDQIVLGRKLCIAWTPLEDTLGLELQLQTKVGTALSEWFEPELIDRSMINNPTLIANNEYRIAIRAWLNNESGVKVYTATTYSDGFIAIDDGVPQISVELDRELLLLSEARERPLHITVNAFDTVRLAGWNLLVYSAQNQLVSIIASAASNQQEFSGHYTWRAEDRFGNQVRQGLYKVIFAVSDDVGQQSLSEKWFTVD